MSGHWVISNMLCLINLDYCAHFSKTCSTIFWEYRIILVQKDALFLAGRFIDGAAKLLFWCQDVERRCQERVQLGRDTAEEKAQFVQVLMEYKQRRAATVFVAHIMRFIMICHSLSVANKFGEWQHLWKLFRCSIIKIGLSNTSWYWTSLSRVEHHNANHTIYCVGVWYLFPVLLCHHYKGTSKVGGRVHAFFKPKVQKRMIWSPVRKYMDGHLRARRMIIVWVSSSFWETQMCLRAYQDAYIAGAFTPRFHGLP